VLGRFARLEVRGGTAYPSRMALEAGPTAGLVAGRFRIEREVGRGAAGIVYRASSIDEKRPVAIKVLDAADEGERFTREGQVLSEIDHPGIVRVIAHGTLEARCFTPGGRALEEGSPFIVMEWLEGEDLQARQRRAPLTLRQALEVGRQVAHALAAAHDAGVVHRDIKPSNIFLVEESPISGVVHAGAGPDTFRTKLVDFGVAAGSDLYLQEASTWAGTPAYMAPEQARGDTIIDARSDIYSLGVTLFELIAGRPLHVGPNLIATLARLITTPAPRLSELLLDVPPALDDLIARMLASEPDGRPASARAVAEELEAICGDPNLPGLARAAPPTDRPSQPTGTRLVTTLVALHVATGEERAWEIDRLREHGADALPLGTDSIVAHLGADRAYGDEGTRALELGLQLLARGAKVGAATGRMRMDRTRPSRARPGPRASSPTAPPPSSRAAASSSRRCRAAWPAWWGSACGAIPAPSRRSWGARTSSTPP
jgi:serine/threonine protein kinase